MNLAPLLEPRSIAVVGANDRPGSYADGVLRNLMRAGFDGAGVGRQSQAGGGPRASIASRPSPTFRRPSTRWSSRSPRPLCRRWSRRPASAAAAAPWSCPPASARSRRAASSRRRCARPPWPTTCRCAGRTGTASSRPGRARRCGGTRSHRSSRDRWPWSRRAATSASTRWDPSAASAGTPSFRPATRRSATPATGSRPLRAWTTSARSRCSSRPTATGRPSRRPSRVAPSAMWASRCSRWARPKPGPARPPRTPAPWRATSGFSAPWSRRRARRGLRVPTSSWSLRGSSPSRRRARASPAAEGLAVLTCSGGDSGVAADAAERLGIALPPLGPATRGRLEELLPPAATIANPLDYTAMIWGDSERLARIVQVVGEDPAIDQLLLCYDHPHDLSPESEASWGAVRDGIVRGAAGSRAGTVVCSTLPDLIDRHRHRGARSRGRPAGRGPGHRALLHSRAANRGRPTRAASARSRRPRGAPRRRPRRAGTAGWGRHRPSRR